MLLTLPASTIGAEESGSVAGQMSPFGIGSCYINNRTAADNARWVPQMQALGLTVYRTPHTDWGALEREPGRWHWETLDEQMDYLEQHGFQFGCTLIGNPGWNSADPRGNMPVNNLKGWSNYVTELAKHVRGRTTRLELWNEPPNFTGKDQTPADYAKLVVAAYQAAKSVDPNFKIGLAAKSAHVNYLEQAIRAGAKDHFDYIVLHPYEVLDGIVDDNGTEQVFLNIVPTVRRMLAAVNPDKQHVPVMYTELGVDAKNGLEVQAHALVKAYTLAIAGGVECVEWFEGRDGDSGPMGLLDREGEPRPAYHALGNLIRHLGRHPQYQGWTRLDEHGLGFVYTGADGNVAVLWAPNQQTAEVQFGKEVEVVDPITGEVRPAAALTLDVAPVLVLDPPAELVARARANRDAPVDWGGDYRQAREVSIEYGEQVIERGLHSRSGDRVAQAVVAYGGSARAGGVPGGNAFIVDPGFLCYDSEPIEITVEVRRNEANDNAGFKLVYESPTGFKTAGGWYTVPDNQGWHTARFEIDDPQFVNYWGFNFLLESDGNQYNKYYLRRVTVRKLDDSL